MGFAPAVLDSVAALAAIKAQPPHSASAQVSLVSEFSRRAEYHGSDVRLDVGETHRSLSWPRMSIDPRRWIWKFVKAIPFRRPDHINVLELFMLVFTHRWKTRCLEMFHTRALHLSDSQVTLAVAVKGRSSSRQLNQLLRQACSVLVSADLYPLLGFIASADNPADAASRIFEKW